MESLTTSSGIVDQFILNGVCESQHQLSLLIDIIVEVHLNPSISLSEDEISEMYNPSFVYSEVSNIHVILYRLIYIHVIL